MCSDALWWRSVGRGCGLLVCHRCVVLCCVCVCVCERHGAMAGSERAHERPVGNGAVRVRYGWRECCAVHASKFAHGAAGTLSAMSCHVRGCGCAFGGLLSGAMLFGVCGLLLRASSQSHTSKVFRHIGCLPMDEMKAGGGLHLSRG